VHARICNGAEASLPWNYCELTRILSLAQASCRLWFDARPAARPAAVSTKSVARRCSLKKSVQIHASSWRGRQCGVARASFDHPIDWGCFYYFVRNSLVALLESLCAWILSLDSWISGFSWQCEGAGLIQFDRGSHLPLATEFTRHRKALSPFFARVFNLISNRHSSQNSYWDMVKCLDPGFG